MSSGLTPQLKVDVQRGVGLIRLLWFAFITPFVAAFLLCCDAVEFKVSGAFLLLLFVFGITCFLRLLFRAKCPRCDWMLLRNPKGMGPARCAISPSCPHGTAHLFGLKFLPSYGVNPWGVQILRAEKEKKIMCLRCGEDFDLRT